eukprot:gb/GECG01009683.1/.p1 GENE.gb/GECG01009683.1/~~gb/GECG01009683.1/.p1  ORF type:complete len:445 (+),score=79.45 gb/GECG01009683.1/:1-1335(+)
MMSSPEEEEKSTRTVKDVRGPRGALTAEKAQELFADVLEDRKTDYTDLVLSTWAWSAEAAEVAARAIAKLPALEVVHMDDIIAGRPEAEALEVYRILSAALVDHKLRVINLSDNAIGPKGLVPLTKLLRDRQYLEEVYFCNDGISAESAQTIADLLLYRTPTTLKRIEFFNNMSGSDGAIAIARLVEASPQLEYFRFSSSRGGKEGGEALANALNNTKNLQHLDLHDNTLGVVTGKALARPLLKQPNLLYLDLGDISLEQEGLEYVASAVLKGPCCHTLEYLDLSTNDVEGEEAAQVVAALLRQLRRLRVVKLEGNEFGNKGARIIAKALEERVADSEIDDTIESLTLKEISTYSSGAVAIARSAAQLPHLQALNLDENYLTEGTVDSIQTIIEEGACASDAFVPLKDNDEEMAQEEEEDSGDDGEEVTLDWEPIDISDADDNS